MQVWNSSRYVRHAKIMRHIYISADMDFNSRLFSWEGVFTDPSIIYTTSPLLYLGALFSFVFLKWVKSICFKHKKNMLQY